MQEPRPESAGERALDRRSVVVAAAALSGAALAKLAGADEARASHNTNIAYDSQTVIHADVTNTTAGSTRVSSNISGTAAFVALNDYPVGISRPDGMLGRTSYTTSGCAGVAGSCEAGSGGIGVLGTSAASTGVGVFGFSGSSVPSPAMPQGTGVFGRGPQRGVRGECTAGTGVEGTTDTGVAVRAEATGTGLAGLFVGRTRVQGVVETVTQGSDGSQRRTYAHTGLAPAFEHVGEAKLRRGRATVKLPPGLDVLVPGKRYQVFLTEYGDLGGLYVSRRGLHEFVVRSRRGGARGRFAYRVVALRADLKS